MADQLAKDRLEPHYEAITTALKTATYQIWVQNISTEKSNAARMSKKHLTDHKWNKQGLHFLLKKY
jgi:hypothetical protein